MKNKVCDLFGNSTSALKREQWGGIIRSQNCPFLEKTCIKIRKSQPEIAIGTCIVRYGRDAQPIIICPFRLLERRQIFSDCLHLLTLHEPGNELHVIPEVAIPGGSVDYFLVSARKGRPIDFVGIELQTLDTTGTVWPERERFLHSVGVPADKKALKSSKSFGMNWKMTAKTILVQLHHKVQTFEHLSKHLVLVAQDCLMDYMKREFSFGHIADPRQGDTMHFHIYDLERVKNSYRLSLAGRSSTSAAGISTALGLQASANVELETILEDIARKIGPHTSWTPV